MLLVSLSLLPLSILLIGLGLPTGIAILSTLGILLGFVMILVLIAAGVTALVIGLK